MCRSLMTQPSCSRRVCGMILRAASERPRLPSAVRFVPIKKVFIRRLGGNDIMLAYQGVCTNMAVAHEFVWAAARYLVGFREVETDRLHCAILAAILGRRTLLRANSYYKNAAVFEHSLSRLPNTVFLPPGAQAMKAPHRGIKNAELRLRSLRRRLRGLV